MFNDLVSNIPRMKLPFISSIIVFSLTVIGFLLVGRVYNAFQARTLIEAMMPTMRTLSFATITSVSTVIALLMTMLGFAKRADSEFEEIFYARIRLIAALGTVALVSATVYLVLMSIPVTEAETLRTWYGVVYAVLVGFSAWVAALLVAIIIILYQALMGLIDALVPQFDSAITKDTEDVGGTKEVEHEEVTES